MEPYDPKPSIIKAVREGWIPWPAALVDKKDNLDDDLNVIVPLIGGTVYEWMKVGGQWFIRRWED